MIPGFRWKAASRSEEHTSELQSRGHLVCRLLLEKKKGEHGCAVGIKQKNFRERGGGAIYESTAASVLSVVFFFFNDTATTEIYTLSLHDALPIRRWKAASARRSRRSCPRTSSTGSRSPMPDRKSTRLNSSHVAISYAVFCLKKKKKQTQPQQPQKNNKNTTKT